jgi:predicted NUDIX family phosphoesterase
VTGEQVLVVARELVPDGAGWYGLRSDDLTAFIDVITRHGRYAPRAAMEVDPRHKQIIPYLVLRDGDRYFLMRRTRAGVDRRLHDHWSIGVGGHLNPGDERPRP